MIFWRRWCSAFRRRTAILSGENTVAAINPDEVITVEGYQFYVDEAVPDGTMAAFTVTITDGTNTWENAVNIPLHAPALDVESIAQYMEEDVYYVKFTFKNIGSAPFYVNTWVTTLVNY